MSLDRGRFRESDILRTVFEVVCNSMKAGLVGGEGFAVDASVIEADASRFKRIEGAVIDWTDEERARRPVGEYLAALESGQRYCAMINAGEAGTESAE